MAQSRIANVLTIFGDVLEERVACCDSCPRASLRRTIIDNREIDLATSSATPARAADRPPPNQSLEEKCLLQSGVRTRAAGWRRVIGVVALVLFVVGAPEAFAQASGNSTVSGTVVESGGVVPGAVVTLTETATSVVRTNTSE